MSFDWRDQPIDTKWGRANLFSSNAPDPLPAAGEVLTTVDEVDVRENDFVALTPKQTYQASYANDTTGRPIRFLYYNQLLVQSYDALTEQLECVDYINGFTYYIAASQLVAKNIIPAGTQMPIQAVNSVR